MIIYLLPIHSFNIVLIVLPFFYVHFLLRVMHWFISSQLYAPSLNKVCYYYCFYYHYHNNNNNNNNIIIIIIINVITVVITIIRELKQTLLSSVIIG